MNIWANTKTLDDYITTSNDKEKAEILLLGSKTVCLEEFPNAKGIFRVGIGRDNVPFDEAKDRNILIRFPSEETIDVIYEETANFTCYLIFKMFYASVGYVDGWVKNSRNLFSDNRLLIIGGGNIGQRVAKKMDDFLEVDVFDIDSNNIEDLRGMIEESDCISLHIPYNLDNKNFFDEEKIGWMKDKAILINTSRGSIVSEDALYDSIKNGKVLAAFDVFWKEPYEGKLKEFYPDEFFMTPHIASTNKKFLENAAKDLMMFVEGFDD